MEALLVLGATLLGAAVGYAVGRRQAATPLAQGSTLPGAFVEKFRQLNLAHEALYNAAFLRAVRARYGCDANAALRGLRKQQEYELDAERFEGVQLTMEGELCLPPVGDRLFEQWVAEAGLSQGGLPPPAAPPPGADAKPSTNHAA